MPDPKAIKEQLNLEPIDPPSKTSSNKDESKSKDKPKGRSRPTDLNIPQLEKALVAQIQLIGTLVSGIDSYDGEVIVDKADDLAENLMELAKANKNVKAFLERLVATGAWSGVITVVVADIALPIAVHHNKLPEPINTIMAETKEIPVKEPKANNNGKQETNTSQIFDNLKSQGQEPA